MATIAPNTTQEYQCLLCGSLGNIVRESQIEEEMKLKCRSPRCGFVYSAKDSSDAMKAGLIPDGPRNGEQDDRRVEDTQDDGRGSEEAPRRVQSEPQQTKRQDKAPRSPSYVLLTKDRLETEFATKKTLNNLIITWTANKKKFDVFELTPKKVQAKVLIQ